MQANIARKLIPAYATEAARLALIEVCAGSDIHASINERAAVQALLDAHRSPTGDVEVLHWSRDCDGTEGTYRYRIHATLLSYYYEFQRIAEGAEGPFSLSIVSPH